MTIINVDKFDIYKFAKKLSKDAEKLLPADLKENQKTYVIKKIYNFCFMAGEALNHDDKIKLTKCDAYCIIQLIGEWTFDKNIDLIRSKIPEKYWEPVLQQVAFEVFELGIKTALEKVEASKAVQMIEDAVKCKYNESLMVLVERGMIDETDLPETLPNSKISKKSNDYPIKKIKCSIRKIIFYLLVIMLNLLVCIFITGIIFLMVYIYSLFVTNGIPFIIKNIKPILLVILVFAALLKGFSCTVKRDVDKQLKQLDEIKQKMRELINPDRMYCRLGIDILSFHIGNDLLKIANPEQEGQLLAKIAALRQKMTDELGYIIPTIRIRDNTDLNPKKYNILVRDVVVEEGIVYPDRVMITCENIEREKLILPENAIAGIDPVTKKSVYWLKMTKIDKDASLNLIDPCDVMVAHIKECVINYADEIITLESATKLVEHAGEKNPACVKNLIPDLISFVDLQKILINLVKERVSIKDTFYIFEKLCDYARFSKDPDVLSEKLRFSLRKHICTKCLDKHKILNVITLPDNYEKTLAKYCHMQDQELAFDLAELKNLIQFITSEFKKAAETINREPVILCSPEIRLVLFRLLNKYFKSIVVLSKKEIDPDIEVFKLD